MNNELYEALENACELIQMGVEPHEVKEELATEVPELSEQLDEIWTRFTNEEDIFVIAGDF